MSTFVLKNSPGATALSLSQAAQAASFPYLVITPDMATAYRLAKESQFFSPQLTIRVFPAWETLAYDHFSPHHDIISERLEVLYQLPRLDRGLLFIDVSTLLQRLAPRHYLEANHFKFQVGQTLDPDTCRKQLQSQGYQAVETVLQHGEFAVRGSLLDIYPMGSELPYRLDLLGSEIDSIRTFDPETQLSRGTISTVNLLPAHEYPLDEKGITRFRQQWRNTFPGDPTQCPLYQGISQGFSPAGIEYYLPLFFEEMNTLFDYLPRDTQIIQLGQFEEAAQKTWEETLNRYESYRYDTTRPLLPPERWLLPLEEALSHLKAFPKTAFHHSLWELPAIVADLKSAYPLAGFKTFLEQADRPILLCTESLGRQEALLAKLHKAQIYPTPCVDWANFLAQLPPFGITVAPLENGLFWEDPPFAVIVEKQLYGDRASQRDPNRVSSQDPAKVIQNLEELRPGSLVVHLDHGIGLYRGLETIGTGDLLGEYLTLEYADQNKLYVPVTHLHLINRYGGDFTHSSQLDHLGSPKWAKDREKAARRAYDAAAELLEIHAQREAQVGFAFAPPDEAYERFAAEFAFEETPDQLVAIQSVIQDMTRPKPMDRLICGDVGFGKTEVAMRAAFLAVQSKKQVAILVPTTLLAQQHYDTFTNRFHDTGILIEALTRFKTASQLQNNLEKLAEGKIDIIIGTHKLLQENVQFKDLGLVIIDEEHRFGVKQKERLKALKAHTDILTLTATPIPRTLNLAFSNLRDLSLIFTPPARRLSIKTFLYEYNPHIIREAVMREISRGGQVYYLHNHVDTIPQRARELKNLLPEANLQIAHGQMRKHELEKIMTDFYHQRFNVLLCTTIIETGIDVPSANTIILERADKLGLAQLHQLRGRVGRSHHQAYAYLLIPEKNALTPEAEKRLEAITSIEDLGAGFMLASQDLEIRGAGEFLGEEQTGHIQNVGLTLYLEFLERAVNSLKSGKSVDFSQPLMLRSEIDLGISALIPDKYVSDIHTRLVLYKRIANAPDSEALRNIQIELIDRFGLLPEPLKNLFEITELKLKAQQYGIKKMTANERQGKLEFDKEPKIDPLKIIQHIQRHPQLYRLEGQNTLRFSLPTGLTPEKRIEWISNLLEKFI